jgi:hypothetical protein
VNRTVARTETWPSGISSFEVWHKKPADGYCTRCRIVIRAVGSHHSTVVLSACPASAALFGMIAAIRASETSPIGRAAAPLFELFLVCDRPVAVAIGAIPVHRDAPSVGARG